MKKDLKKLTKIKACRQIEKSNVIDFYSIEIYYNSHFNKICYTDLMHYLCNLCMYMYIHAYILQNYVFHQN